MIPTILVPTVSILFIVVMMIIVTKGGNQQIYLFENGLQTYGTLIKKVKIDLHDATIYRVTFEYEVNGQKYKMWEDISSMARLEDDEKEPILYNPKNPKKAILLDGLPAHITVDDTGNLKHKYSFMGYVYLSIPIALIMGMIYLSVK
ncbi:MAG: hypothetical protein COS68_04215 [Elusimicrobia bacterium CG06_land_8_20_14_3_00_38_11]|nr:MAG: hypothetical protein COS68_04215 [Elusimicrobia bacterium CG06_land_8_20_14_3_00_38_11]